MTISHDRARETGIDMAEDLQRDVVTRQVCRGVGRLVRTLGFSSLNELPLPNGRRADIVALSASGDIWIIEVKSSVEDFRADQKWPEYREFSDQLYFAVRVALGSKLLPDEKAFFLLDDPFIKSDTQRLKKQLGMLLELSRIGWQVLYFSAKDEVKNMLKTATVAR